MNETVRQLALGLDTPPDERFDASVEMHKAYRPLASQLIPPENLRPVIDYINNGLMDAEFYKATPRQIIRLGDGNDTGGRMRSVRLDPQKIFSQARYFERPSALDFTGLRAIVAQTPILSAIVRRRVRQVSRFAQISEDGGLGFEIRHKDRNHLLKGTEADAAAHLARFFLNCGWEFNPRRRKLMHRDNFRQFMAKSVRDSLTLDSCPIETEMRRNAELGLDGFYAVDGATIRLCSEQHYEGDDPIYALQVIDGRIGTTYTIDQLIYEVRNPRTDVDTGGYGEAEPEVMIKVITGILNAMSYNNAGFDENSIPKGILQLIGDYGQEDIAAFKRYWNAMVKGTANTWALPVMVSKDAQSKVAFEKFDTDFNEMHFAKWMTFLTSIACAIYGMAPDEINFESFSASKSSLSGSDTEAKLENGQDTGLLPLLAFYEATFSDFIVSAFNDDWCFRFVGLDSEDAGAKAKEDESVMTVNELRGRRGDAPFPDPVLGNAPLNPSLIQPWMELNKQRFAGAGTDDDQRPGDPGRPSDPPPDGDADTPLETDDPEPVRKSLATVYTVE